MDNSILLGVKRKGFTGRHAIMSTSFFFSSPDTGENLVIYLQTVPQACASNSKSIVAMTKG